MRAVLCVLGLVVACSSTAENVLPGPGSAGSSGVGGAGTTASGGSVSSGAGGTDAGHAGTEVAGAGGATGGTDHGAAGSLAVGGSAGVGAAGAAAAGSSGVGGTGGSSPTAGSGGQIVALAGAGGSTDGGATSAGDNGGGAAGEGGEPAMACVCDSGPCCDGCHFLPKSHFCGEVVRSSSCIGAASCGGGSVRISNDYWNLFCNGDVAECTRWAVHTKYVQPECADGTSCIGADGSASCAACN